MYNDVEVMWASLVLMGRINENAIVAQSGAGTRRGTIVEAGAEDRVGGSCEEAMRSDMV